MRRLTDAEIDDLRKRNWPTSGAMFSMEAGILDSLLVEVQESRIRKQSETRRLVPLSDGVQVQVYPGGRLIAATPTQLRALAANIEKALDETR